MIKQMMTNDDIVLKYAVIFKRVKQFIDLSLELII